MTDPASGLRVDPDEVARLSAELQQLALRWLGSDDPPQAATAVFGTDPDAAELSSALPVFVARVQQARGHGSALLAAASAALGAACGALRETDGELPRASEGPR